MIKKLLIGVTLPVAAGMFLFGTDAYSYLTTSAKKVRGELKSNVPVEFELDRLKLMISDLIPDIQNNMHVIAEEEVDVEVLGDQIERTEENLAQERIQIKKLRSDINNANRKFYLSRNRLATGADVRQELYLRFERFKDAVATLKARKAIYAAREKALASTRDKLEGMLAERRNLEVQVSHLEARLRMLQAMQTTSEFSFDDSRLVRCRKLVRELRKRLDVAQRLIEQDGRLVEWLSEESEVPEDLSQRIDEYFGAESDQDDEPSLLVQ